MKPPERGRTHAKAAIYLDGAAGLGYIAGRKPRRDTFPACGSWWRV